MGLSSDYQVYLEINDPECLTDNCCDHLCKKFLTSGRAGRNRFGLPFLASFFVVRQRMKWGLGAKPPKDMLIIISAIKQLCVIIKGWSDPEG